jgi:transcription elongation factor GreB
MMVAHEGQARRRKPSSMSKASTRESNSDPDDRDDDGADALPAQARNYVTPTGHAALQTELGHLLQEERPKVVEVVSWAASNGDRSENADYHYGKKRLREIDRRVRYLTKRLDSAVLVDPTQQQALRRVFFGATVTYARADGREHTVTLVGVDEADLSQGKVSWLSPIARALMKAKVDDNVQLRTPAGVEDIEIIAIRYGSSSISPASSSGEASGSK